MSEAEEMYEGIESVIEDLIADYNRQLLSGDIEEQLHAEGAIAGLNRLLEVLNED